MDRPLLLAAAGSAMTIDRASSRVISVVIIARNESARIGACIESVLAATARRFVDAQIVVVDSNSQDTTAAVAAKYPVQVFRYRAARTTAAAGRWIGFRQVEARYVLFLDGDCELVKGWLEIAVDTMEATPTAGVICGARQDAHLTAHGLELQNVGCRLGGVALYRSTTLAQAGSFNPHVIAGEEQELAARILQCGFSALTTTELMSVHHTNPKASAADLWRRFRTGMQSGPGQVLRTSIRDGLFFHHLRQFDRYAFTMLFLIVGAAALVAMPWSRVPLELWLLGGAVVFFVLWWRRRHLHEVLFILTDWVSVALSSIPSFFARPAPRDRFEHGLERIPNRAPPEHSAAGAQR
jgi:glycosyltransferase involved in cell wall biosynthesis